jgi:hypothetical protein
MGLLGFLVLVELGVLGVLRVLGDLVLVLDLAMQRDPWGQN